jgi:hypothetical protein
MRKSERQLLARFFLQAKKCGAKSKRNNHLPCKNAAMKNGRCRMHGGKSTGPKTEEGKKKAAAANLKDGRYTNAAIMERRRMRMMMQWRGDLEDI